MVAHDIFSIFTNMTILTYKFKIHCLKNDIQIFNNLKDSYLCFPSWFWWHPQMMKNVQGTGWRAPSTHFHHCNCIAILAYIFNALNEKTQEQNVKFSAQLTELMIMMLLASTNTKVLLVHEAACGIFLHYKPMGLGQTNTNKQAGYPFAW